jgi:hypothetical protein
MLAITTEEELVEFLFQELDESRPQQAVDPSFLLRVGGLCHGLIYGGWDGTPPYLSDTLAIHWRDREPTKCGTKLVAFAQRLASEGCFDPTRIWTVTDLAELMIAILDRDDLSIREDPKDHERYVVSSPRFTKRRGIKIRVQVGATE